MPDKFINNVALPRVVEDNKIPRSNIKSMIIKISQIARYLLQDAIQNNKNIESHFKLQLAQGSFEEKIVSEITLVENPISFDNFGQKMLAFICNMSGIDVNENMQRVLKVIGRCIAAIIYSFSIDAMAQNYTAMQYFASHDPLLDTIADKILAFLYISFCGIYNDLCDYTTISKDGLFMCMQNGRARAIECGVLQQEADMQYNIIVSLLYNNEQNGINCGAMFNYADWTNILKNYAHGIYSNALRMLGSQNVTNLIIAINNCEIDRQSSYRSQHKDPRSIGRILLSDPQNKQTMAYVSTTYQQPGVVGYQSPAMPTQYAPAAPPAAYPAPATQYAPPVAYPPNQYAPTAQYAPPAAYPAPTAQYAPHPTGAYMPPPMYPGQAPAMPAPYSPYQRPPAQMYAYGR